MALTTTYMTNPVKTVIVNQTASTSNSGAGDNNVAGGPVYIVQATLNNTQYGTAVYTKFYNATSATAGTDTATMILYGKASTSHTYVFHPPIFFSNGISMVTTTTAGQAGTTAPSTPPAVTLVLSESAS